jgi:lactoylglutathione lyase
LTRRREGAILRNLAVAASPEAVQYVGPARKRRNAMRFVHTMIRVNDLDQTLKFYCDALGMKLLRKKEYPSGRFTNAFVGFGSEDKEAVIELTYNWDTHEYELGNAFGHLAVGVPDVYETCEQLRSKGVKITREPGPMKHGGNVIAFIEDPNGYKIELTTRRE